MPRDASRRDDVSGGFGIFVVRHGGFKINFPLPYIRAGIQLYQLQINYKTLVRTTMHTWLVPERCDQESRRVS